MSNTEQAYTTFVDIPNNLTEFRKMVHPHSLIIGGGTLLQLNWEAGMKKPKHIISVEKLSILKRIEEVDCNGEKFIRIGSATSIASCLKDPILAKNAKILSEACLKIAAPAVRNRATLGGNICSKIGDCIPVLLALGAKLQFYGESEYTLSIAEWLNKGNAPNTDLLLYILIPLDKSDCAQIYSFFKKVGRREAFTAAIITIAGYVEMKNSAIQDVRLSVGGGSHNACYLVKAEQELLNKEIDQIDWKILYESIENGFSTYTDPFVTEEYRKTITANLMVANLKTLLYSLEEE